MDWIDVQPTLMLLRGRRTTTVPHTRRERAQITRGVLTRVLVLLALSVTGCAGSARVELASLDFSSIEPPPPRAQAVAFERCYWWTDETDALWIAAERDAPSLLGEAAHVTVQFSLRLARLPRGASRQEQFRNDGFRGRIRVGPAESRLSSNAGIAVTDRPRGDRLRGSLRLLANREQLQLLGGWSRGARLLVLGEFDAVLDAARGERIRNATEADGFERKRPASQPTAVR